MAIPRQRMTSALPHRCINALASSPVILPLCLWRDVPGPYHEHVFLGEDLLAWLMLAIGGALGVGNVLAVVRPPAAARDGELERAPVGRSLGMAAVGFVVAIWGLASLIRG